MLIMSTWIFNWQDDGSELYESRAIAYSFVSKACAEGTAMTLIPDPSDIKATAKFE
jgi:hypothetical protein